MGRAPSPATGHQPWSRHGVGQSWDCRDSTCQRWESHRVSHMRVSRCPWRGSVWHPLGQECAWFSQQRRSPAAELQPSPRFPAGRRSSEVVHRFHLPWGRETTMSSAFAQGEVPASPHNLMPAACPVPGLSPPPGWQQPRVHPPHHPGRAQRGGAGGPQPSAEPRAG